jgi:hypothetical protein
VADSCLPLTTSGHTGQQGDAVVDDYARIGLAGSNPLVPAGPPFESFVRGECSADALPLAPDAHCEGNCAELHHPEWTKRRRVAMALDQVDSSTPDGMDGAITKAVAEITERRAVIEQAKGVLMVVYDIAADSAFDLLRLSSQHTNTKLRVLAVRLTTESRPLQSRQEGHFVEDSTKCPVQPTSVLTTSSSPYHPQRNYVLSIRWRAGPIGPYPCTPHPCAPTPGAPLPP